MLTAEAWAWHCRKVQERFAWLDEKNARDIEGHSQKHPVSFFCPVESSWKPKHCGIALYLVKLLLHQSQAVSSYHPLSLCIGSDNVPRMYCMKNSDWVHCAMQDYDPRTVKVPPVVLGKMSGMLLKLPLTSHMSVV